MSDWRDSLLPDPSFDDLTEAVETEAARLRLAAVVPPAELADYEVRARVVAASTGLSLRVAYDELVTWCLQERGRG